MKINTRILLINFLVVLITIGGSAIAFYSVVEELITSQESKRLFNSTNDFLNILETQSKEMDKYIVSKTSDGDDLDIVNFTFDDETPVDFIFKLEKDSLISPQNIIANSSIHLSTGTFTLKNFASKNPYVLIKNFKNKNNDILYYGINFSGRRLDIISRQIKSEIAVFLNTDIVVYSNETANGKFAGFINDAFEDLFPRNNFDIYFSDEGETAFFASIYKMREFAYKETAFNILVFSTMAEFSLLRTALQKILLVLGVVGLFLGIILTFIFTAKLRNQIVKLYKATLILKHGFYQNRIPVVSKDEIGSLATAFNTMLDELQKREYLTSHYTEFLTLINNNPSLEELSKAAVNKILLLGDFTIGSLCLVQDETIGKLIYSNSISISFNEGSGEKNFYEPALTEKKVVEYHMDHYSAKVNGEALSLPINYLMILPVVHNQKVIALLEFGASRKPKIEFNSLIGKLFEQLAIGLANAITLNQLEKLIEQLKDLNRDYQKQNLDIVDKNEKLTNLSEALRKQAGELERQKTIAEEAAKTKSRFIATMSHELRTPMNSIIGLTDLLINDATLNSKNFERISVVNKSSKRLMNLINDVLDLSKIEAGKLVVKYESFSLKNFIDDIYASLKPLTREKEIDLIFDFHPQINLLVKTDQLKLGQILTNIIGNAIKFTSAGYVKVKCTIKNYSLKFIVEDTGIGINKGHLRSIFEEYEQAETGIIHKYTGTGLGLSIAKNFIELLGGTITVESELNKGTIFTIQIPVELSYSTEAESENKITESVSSKNIIEEKFIVEEDNLRPINILITEDDQSSLFTLSEIVKELKCKVFAAKNGKECLSILHETEIDIILLDIMMPEMNGFQTITEIRKNDKWKEIPIFAITAKAMESEFEIIFRYGFNGIFPKPVDREQLLYKLNSELKKQKVRSSV